MAVLFVPQVAKTGLLIWLGEYDRSQRAGKWIADLEVWIDRWIIQGTATRVPSPAFATPAQGSALKRCVRRTGMAFVSVGQWLARGAGTRIPADGEKRKITVNRPMGWESKLISHNQHMGYPYLSTALLLLGAGWASVFVGLGILYINYHSNGSMVTASLVAILATAVIVESWFALFFRAKWISVRRDYSIPLDTSDIRHDV